MKNDEEIVQSLLAGGLIGEALGALISKQTDEGATLGAIAGASLLATYKANEKARETKVIMYVEEKGYLYKLEPEGNKILIRKIEKPAKPLPQHFKLK